MGGCASKPKRLKAEVDAPALLDEPPTASDPAAGGAGEKAGEDARCGGEAEQPGDSSRRRSLGVLFRENEESSVPSASDEIVAKDTAVPPTAEPKGEAEQPEGQDDRVKDSEHKAALTDEGLGNADLKAEVQPVEGEAAESGSLIGKEGSPVTEKKGDAELPAAVVA